MGQVIVVDFIPLPEYRYLGREKIAFFYDRNHYYITEQVVRSYAVNFCMLNGFDEPTAQAIVQNQLWDLQQSEYKWIKFDEYWGKAKCEWHYTWRNVYDSYRAKKNYTPTRTLMRNLY